MKTTWTSIIALTVLLLAAACTQQLRESAEAYAPTEQERAFIEDRLLQIRKDMLPRLVPPTVKDSAARLNFDQLDEELRWKLMDCSATLPILSDDSMARLQEQHKIMNRLRQSKSTDAETHGRALYHLFANDADAYYRAGSITQPDGQAIVKATYQALLLDSVLPQSNRQAALGDDGKWYREGDPQELFILFRTDRTDVQTDSGWVYGIVSVPEEKVIAQGLLQNCMGCHRKNDPDRLYGLPAK